MRLTQSIITSAVCSTMLASCGPKEGDVGQPSRELLQRSPTLQSYMIPPDELEALHPDVRPEDLHPECGHTVLIKSGDRALALRGGLHHVGRATELPEYHDCQALISPSNTRVYAQLAALYATQELRPEDLPLHQAFLLGYVINYGEYKQNGIGSGLGDSYPELGLEKGVSCIYGQTNRAIADYGSAWIKPVSNGIDCDPLVMNVSTLASYKRLRLKRKEIADPSGNAYPLEAYPLVARWDWDSANSQQYIGIQCGAAWCEIGPENNFNESAVPAPPQGAPMPNSHVYRIKGWFDSQRLAVYNSINSRIEPGAEIGYIYPHPHLDLFPDTLHFNQQRWVATLTIDRRSDIYKNKFLIEPNGDAARMFLQRQGANNWHRQLARGIGTPNGLKGALFRTKGPEKPDRLRGTVRWRWLDTDESSWVSCINGCCQVDPL